MSSAKAKFLDVLTISVAICALGMSGLAGWRAMNPRPALSLDRPDKRVKNFEDIAAVGHRTGSADPTLTIVEFGDYECGACRASEVHVAAILRKYPHEVAVIRRHYPLNYHPNAYRAARAAECAAEQGKFDDIHPLLYSVSRDDLSAGMTIIAERATMPDLALFEACVTETTKIPAVERDIATANDLGLTGTPMFIVNGMLLGSIPDSLDFEGMLRKAR